MVNTKRNAVIIMLMVAIFGIVSILGVSSVNAATKIGTPKVTAKASSTSKQTTINYSWPSVSGAKKYEFWIQSYGKPGGDNKTANPITTTSTKRTVKWERSTVSSYKVKCKVRGVNGNTKGSWSSVVTTTIPKIAKGR